MIEARELTKRYGDTTAVHSLNFTIAPGTVTGFLGPNGAGKSMSMRMTRGGRLLLPHRSSSPPKRTTPANRHI